MPVERKHHASTILLIDGPLAGVLVGVLTKDIEEFEPEAEFEVGATDKSRQIERYRVSRYFEIECGKHGILYRRIIALHVPRVNA